MQLTRTEENYLKSIYKIFERTNEAVHTNAIAEKLNTTAASVTDMMKRLSKKELVHYEKYRGTRLTQVGTQVATTLIRRHRIWETFLVEKLDFPWEEVHDIAEELEHIQSKKLIDRLDQFLEFPKFDPHGDPIPNAEGKFTLREQVSLGGLKVGEQGNIIGVKIHDKTFLEYLNDLGISIGSHIKVVNFYSFDGSMQIIVDESEPKVISQSVGRDLLIKKLTE